MVRFGPDIPGNSITFISYDLDPLRQEAFLRDSSNPLDAYESILRNVPHYEAQLIHMCLKHEASVWISGASKQGRDVAEIVYLDLICKRASVVPEECNHLVFAA